MIIGSLTVAVWRITPGVALQLGLISTVVALNFDFAKERNRSVPDFVRAVVDHAGVERSGWYLNGLASAALAGAGNQNRLARRRRCKRLVIVVSHLRIWSRDVREHSPAVGFVVISLVGVDFRLRSAVGGRSKLHHVADFSDMIASIARLWDRSRRGCRRWSRRTR
jgi:hypothetical protein